MKKYYVLEINNGDIGIRDLKYVIENRKGVKLLGEVQGSYLKVKDLEANIPTHLLFKI